jgi:hypothetical protein
MRGRVVNRTRTALLCRMWLIEVAPLATSSTSVPFQLDDFAAFDRAIAEIAGDGVHCIVEAPALPRPKRTRTLSIIALASTVAGVLALGAAMLFRGAVPQVDGRALQGRQIAGHAGSIAAQIPRPMPSHAKRQAYVEGIWVTPAVAEPGQKVDVAYSAAGDRGYVRLLGTDGTIWRQLPFSHAGRAEFVVPPVTSLHEMRVLLHVSRGRMIAQAMAGLAVATGSPSPGPVPSDQNGVFTPLESTVQSGGIIHLRILAPHSGMTIALMDPQSHEVATVDAGGQSDVVTLRAPTVTLATAYTLVASFSDGYGQESVIAPITILP